MTDSEIHAVQEMLGISDNIIFRLREALVKAKIRHNRCEDEFYSCPATGECSRIEEGDDETCDCGAEQHNQEIDEALRGREV